MKKIILLTAMTLCGSLAFAQKDNVGIGTTKPDQSAALEISSSNKGLLTPRMSLQQRNDIQNPATGLMVYQTDLLSGFYFYDGKEWKSMASETGSNSVADANNWGLTGNTLTTPGTNFIGTIDNQSVMFKVNNNNAGLIGNDGRTFLGLLAGLSNTGTYNVGIGFQALKGATGANNVGVGLNALLSNTTGANNVGIGANALVFNQGGGNNMALGNNALYNNISGSFNIGVGDGSLYNSTGSNNVALGQLAGSATTGSNSIFIGHNAGSNETTGGKLYIANTGTVTPLVYGDFTTKYLAVGEVAAADRAAATSGGYRLLVKGGMITEKIKVAVAGSADWADYVFEDSYKMLSLEQVEKFIKENKHLPNVPSTTEVLANGVDVAKTDAKLLEKIEELTLYMIEMNKELKALKNENIALKKQVGKK
jgi:hypothetical protein